MKTPRSDLALVGLAVVSLLAELACVLTGHQAPGVFEQVTLLAVAGAAGVALPVHPTDPAPAAARGAVATYQTAPAVPPTPAPAAGATPHTLEGL